MKTRSKKPKQAKRTTKSIMIGRIPRGNQDEYSRVFVKYFSVNDPHTKEVYPFNQEEFPNIAEIRFNGFKIVSYLTEGKDLLVNDITELSIEKKATTLIVKGKQRV